MKPFVACLAFVVLAGCSGSNGPAAPETPTPPAAGPTVPPGASALVTAMFERLPTYIGSQLTELQSILPSNPNNATQINAKIALLQRSTLVSEMVTERMFAEGSVTSTNGRSIAIAALFPEAAMRADAADAVRKLEQALPLLETFVSTPYPADALQIWYGFKVGNSGTRGAIYTEDRASYASRPLATLPFDAALYHELSHGFFGSESLTQFLEIYLFNRQNGGSQSFASWTYRRTYTPMADSNGGYAALLDVYQLIGYDAMSRAYTLAFPLAPPYNQPLSQAVQQVFIDQAPGSVKALVAAKMARILT